jgi:isopentenyl phosphate kinase
MTSFTLKYGNLEILPPIWLSLSKLLFNSGAKRFRSLKRYPTSGFIPVFHGNMFEEKTEMVGVLRSNSLIAHCFILKQSCLRFRAAQMVGVPTENAFKVSPAQSESKENQSTFKLKFVRHESEDSHQQGSRELTHTAAGSSN